EYRARGARSGRQGMAGAGARHRADAMAGLVRELLSVDDLLLGRVRHFLPAYPLRHHLAGRDLEPVALRPQSQDQCRGGSCLPRLHRFRPSVRARAFPETQIMTPLVQVKKVSQLFGSMRALEDVSLDIAPETYTVLLGPSGSGKTTLLSILVGFLEPSEGQVLIKGEDCTTMPPAKRPTTTVFQDYALFPHMTVGGNVGFGMRMRGVAATERAKRAREVLAMVGLAEAFDKKPHQLSGGQRQRVALARALVVEPSVLLLDEPLGALDLKLRRQMQDELKALQRRVGTAFIHVTHDQEEAMALGDICVVMNQGRIEDSGPPDRVYSRPATRFSAAFMGENTLLPGNIL